MEPRIDQAILDRSERIVAPYWKNSHQIYKFYATTATWVGHIMEESVLTGLRSWDEWLAADLPTADWLIPGLLEKGGAGVLHGPPSSFKSFFLLRLCLDLAAGLPVLGIWAPKRQYRTVMLQAEGSEGAWQRRMKAIRAGYPDGIPFWSIHTLSTKLDTPKGLEMMKKILVATLPDLVVVDPMANFFQGAENDENMQRWFDTANVWRASPTQPGVLLSGHDRQTIRGFVKGVVKSVFAGMDEARGHSRLPGWADFVGAMYRKKDVSTLTVQKTREGEGGQEFKFKLEDGLLVLTERSDAVEEIVLGLLASEELMQAEVIAQVRGQMGGGHQAPRRAIQRLIGQGKVEEVKVGKRVRLRRVLKEGT